MEIREAQPGDLDAWVTLRRALWPDDPSESLFTEAKRVLSSPDEVCFLLLHPSLGAVGFIEAALHPGANAPYAHVEGWYVAPEYRRQGQGRKLMDRIEQWCLHRTIRALTSDTDAKYPLNPAAHAGCGFRTLAELKIFIRELHPPCPDDPETRA